MQLTSIRFYDEYIHLPFIMTVHLIQRSSNHSTSQLTSHSQLIHLSINISIIQSFFLTYLLKSYHPIKFAKLPTLPHDYSKRLKLIVTLHLSISFIGLINERNQQSKTKKFDLFHSKNFIIRD